MVAELAADFALGQGFSAVSAGALCRVPEAITAPTRHSSIEVVERADASTTQRALQPHALTHDAAAGRNQRHTDDTTGDKLQIERAGFEPHQSQPRKSNVEVKYRAHRPIKHMLADQFAHVESDLAVVFNSPIALRFRLKQALRQPLACNYTLPPSLRLIACLARLLASPHVIQSRMVRMGRCG